jgi:hypothetical protein
MWTLILVTLLVTDGTGGRSAAVATQTVQFSSSTMCDSGAKAFRQAADFVEFPKSDHSDASARYRIIAQCVQTSVGVQR